MFLGCLFIKFDKRKHSTIQVKGISFLNSPQLSLQNKNKTCTKFVLFFQFTNFQSADRRKPTNESSHRDLLTKYLFERGYLPGKCLCV